MVVDLAGQIRIIFIGRFQNNLRRQPYFPPRLSSERTFEPFVSL